MINKGFIDKHLKSRYLLLIISQHFTSICGFPLLLFSTLVTQHNLTCAGGIGGRSALLDFVLELTYQSFTYKASLSVLRNTFEHIRTEPYLPFINHLRTTQQNSRSIVENTFEHLIPYSAIQFEI
jgi:hypothetical protein